jgi:predicted AAA+ superfamily ATPase
MNMKMNSNKMGVIGETAVALELLKRGFDVININNSYQNYKNADLICMNAETGKSVMIQVKTGTTHNIFTGFVSELDGTIPNIENTIIGPWVFVYIPEQDFSDIQFYILTKEEIDESVGPDYADYFGLYGDDLIVIRNDARCADYHIERDLRNSFEADEVNNDPPIIDWGKDD